MFHKTHWKTSTIDLCCNINLFYIKIFIVSFLRNYFAKIFKTNLSLLRSHRGFEVFYKKEIYLKISFVKFIGKHLCWRLFFIKVAALRPDTLLKKRLRRMCFPMSFVKFSEISCLQNTSGRLLLSLIELLYTTASNILSVWKLIARPKNLQNTSSVAVMITVRKIFALVKLQIDIIKSVSI